MEHDVFQKPVPTPAFARASFFGIMLQPLEGDLLRVTNFRPDP